MVIWSRNWNDELGLVCGKEAIALGCLGEERESLAERSMFQLSELGFLCMVAWLSLRDEVLSGGTSE